jgi:hypothetical protein
MIDEPLRPATSRRVERLLAYVRRWSPLMVAPLVLLIGFTFWVAATRPIRDPDVWWVAAVGRDFLARGQLPHENYYSFVEPHHPWVMHEWLTALPFHLGLDALGPGFFALLTLVSCALKVALLLYMTIGRTRRIEVGLLFAALGVCCLPVAHPTPRVTQLALLFPLLLCAIAFRPRFTWKTLLAATLIECLWANTHGSFPVGVVLLGVSAIDQPVDRARRILAVALAAAVTLINPYGLALHRLVWDYFTAKSPTFDRINHYVVEFSPIWRYPDPAEIAGLVLVVLLTLAAVHKRRHLARCGLALVLVAMAVLHIRHVMLAGSIVCVLLPGVFDEESVKPRLRMVTLMVAPALLVALVAFGVTAHRRGPLAWLHEPEVVRLGAMLPADARAYVAFSGSSVVLYHQSQRGVRIYLDPRNDCYSAPTLDTIYGLSDSAFPDRDKALDLLSRTGSQYALVPSASRLAQTLTGEAQWPLVASDGAWRLFRHQ